MRVSLDRPRYDQAESREHPAQPGAIRPKDSTDRYLRGGWLAKQCHPNPSPVEIPGYQGNLQGHLPAAFTENADSIGKMQPTRLRFSIAPVSEQGIRRDITGNAER
jgi:hypothetical protein